MKEILPDLLAWQQEENAAIALATVLQTWGSAPRKAGAKMAFTAGGAISGSVSGGCIEGAVITAGETVLATGQPQHLHFGVADETAWEVGLACGGEIELFVQPLNTAVFPLLSQQLQADQLVHSFTIIRGPDDLLGRQLVIAADGRSAGHLTAELDAFARQFSQSTDQPATQRLPPSDQIELFVEIHRPAPTLIIVGGVHIAIALTPMARALGFRTIVIDPRRAFGNAARFPHADQLLPLWPGKAFAQLTLTAETAVALLTHDPKIDDPALQIVLESPAFYVGALGSRKTHAKRVARLQAVGLSPSQTDRIHAPIGLDIGAQTPEEIALSVMAQIVQAYRQRPAA